MRATGDRFRNIVENTIHAIRICVLIGLLRKALYAMQLIQEWLIFN